MLNALSLFSSSGVGDLGLRSNGIETVIACELLQERMQLFRENFPNSKCFCGDIWQLSDEIIRFYTKDFKDAPFLILATPPCQGMSSNGMGKILSDFRKGLRPHFDERNRLIIPTIKIIKSLQPEWVILENVANMINTCILDEMGNIVNIIDYIKSELKNYKGKEEVVNCADYGVPQYRKRLITIFSRTSNGKKTFCRNNSFLPNKLFAETEDLYSNKWRTLRDSIANFPELVAEKGKNKNYSFHPLHKVPLLDDKKLLWVRNTKEGDTAFNNQCINPDCLFQDNPIHGAKKDSEGINRYNGDTPLYCQKCGLLLPRPWVEDKATGKKRIMKGYVSAYKRMAWDEPASTLTQNFQFACSDNKLHPEQDRVLSMFEAMVLQSITDYNYSFEINGKYVADGLIRDTIGESVPPKIINLISKHIIGIENGHVYRTIQPIHL
jgi:DNA (cytosine-5)-methyltransferase 1